MNVDIIRSIVNKIREEIKDFNLVDQHAALAEVLAGLKGGVSAFGTETAPTAKSPLFKIGFGSDFKLIETGTKVSKVSRIVLKPYLAKDEPEIMGTELGERARALDGFAGQSEGEEILEIQKFLQPEFRGKYFIPLPATRYLHLPTNEVWFPCLERNTGSGDWRLGLRCENTKFSSNGRLVTI
jgi:hypothetical protein